MSSRNEGPFFLTKAGEPPEGTHRGRKENEQPSTEVLMRWGEGGGARKGRRGEHSVPNFRTKEKNGTQFSPAGERGEEASPAKCAKEEREP